MVRRPTSPRAGRCTSRRHSPKRCAASFPWATRGSRGINCNARFRTGVTTPAAFAARPAGQPRVSLEEAIQRTLSGTRPFAARDRSDHDMNQPIPTTCNDSSTRRSLSYDAGVAPSCAPGSKPATGYGSSFRRLPGSATAPWHSASRSPGATKRELLATSGARS